jgi:hypothetical protein
VRIGLDWRTLAVIGRVHGQERQRAAATEMHFSIPTLVAFISGIMTLEPGDLIATGTPAGVGPLHDGDVVEVEIPGVGILSNPVRNGTRRGSRPASDSAPCPAILSPKSPRSSAGSSRPAWT